MNIIQQISKLNLLNGWQRIFTLVSTLWLLVVLVYSISIFPSKTDVENRLAISQETLRETAAVLDTQKLALQEVEQRLATVTQENNKRLEELRTATEAAKIRYENHLKQVTHRGVTDGYDSTAVILHTRYLELNNHLYDEEDRIEKILQPFKNQFREINRDYERASRDYRNAESETDVSRKNLNELPQHQIILIVVTPLVWAISSGAFYFFGWLIGWIYRGFRQPT